MKKRIFKLFVLTVGLSLLLGASSGAAQKPIQRTPYLTWDGKEEGAVQQQAWNVRLVGQIDTPGSAVGVAVAGNYAYVADDGGLRIIDISNPAAPSETGFYDTPGYAYGVAVTGNYAYVADYYSGLRIIDVSNPAAPSETGFYDTPGSAVEVAVTGNYAYVADGGSLRIIDVSNPAAPSETGFYDTPGSASGVAVAGNYAFVADHNSGLRIIDVSNPAAPSETGFYDTQGEALGVAVTGDYAYVADGLNGLRIIDVSNTAAPSEAGFYNTPDKVWNVVASGNYAYVAGSNGIRIIDISDRTTPSETGFYITSHATENVAQGSIYTYVADGANGLLILFYAPYWTYLPHIARSCSPLFADNFSDPNSGWPSGDDGNARYEYLNGEYRILLRNPDWWAATRPGFQASDYILATDVRNMTEMWEWGSYGLIFGISSDWSQFYTFEIFPIGYYRIYHYNTGTWTSLGEGNLDNLNTGTGKNRLKIKREGNLIEAYVNGELVEIVSDGSYTGMRYVGLFAGTIGELNLDVRFDDFAVYPSTCNIDVVQIGETILAPNLEGLDSTERWQMFSQPHSRER